MRSGNHLLIFHPGRQFLKSVVQIGPPSVISSIHTRSVFVNKRVSLLFPRKEGETKEEKSTEIFKDEGKYVRRGDRLEPFALDLLATNAPVERNRDKSRGLS